MKIASPNFDYPALAGDGRLSEPLQDFLFDLWFRTGREAGIAGFSLLSDQVFTNIFEDTQGNTYLTNNARYNATEGYWERIDETRTSWMVNLLGVSEPLEEALGLPAQTAGFWIAQPSKVGGVNNPAFTPETPTRKIKDGFTGAAGGWERGISVTQFGDLVVRGYGIELDANGIVPFSRPVGGFAPGAGTYRWFGRITNVYLDHSGTDRAKKGSAANVLRSTAATEEPFDWAVLAADATDPSAADDEVGTTAPDFDRVTVRAQHVTSSVNNVLIKPSVTTEPVSIEAEGTDTNIGVKLAAKGTGSVIAKNSGTGHLLRVEDANTTAGNVGIKAIGNNAYVRAGNNDVVEVDFATNVAIGAAAVATTATDGFLYIPTCAGAPTGTPTTKTGRAPVVYDTTNNNLCIYNGGWKTVALT